MAGQRDIEAWFLILRDKANALAGADLPDSDREVVQMLAGTAINLLESLFLDINRIADAQETIARTAMDEFQRKLGR